jgi:hypothetical protein
MKQLKFWGGAAAGVALTLIGMYAMEQAQAQQDGQFGRPGGGGFQRPGGQGQGGGGFPGGPMMGMGGGGGSLTATDRYVYVLRGNTLYQFSADGLQLKARAELPQPPRPGGNGGGFGDPPPPPTEK